ncbi:transmembrane ascorbate-dependent reductase CYB561 isoform X6 [Balaenoptera acutorostrata]|uniref:Transmembrane ascorbate-dependent reductase CYB561 n=1 Tax=Balaenoptera acutorostrata TaxID=9767 RepID=A0ABM3SR29_BALAC|nr:transmembrane ascorbate-dependent reductase CYB561 isoform X6 [Balaenoptera acutorostrata]
MESPARPAPAPAALLYYVAFSQLLGLAVVAMTGTWLGVYRGGIAWESALQFNVHPLCMIIGLVFLQGDALLVYRVFRNEAKRTTKILHGLLHVFAFVIALVGLVAVFDYHRKEGYADLYSLHSWCGILVFVLFFVQARGFGPRSHLGAHSVGLGPASSAGRPSPRAQRSRRRSGRRPPRGGVAGPAVLEGGGPPGASLGSSLQRSSASGSTSPFLPVARGL